MLKLLANVISDLLDTWTCLQCLSICWYCRTILSIHLVFRLPASDLRHVLMFWWICQTWISSNSGCCPVARLQARTADKYWTTIEAGENCISHPLKEDSVCRGGDLVFIDLGFLFSQLCFLTHSLRSSWLHSAQSAQMHFGHHCNAPSTVMLWTAQFENGIYNNTVCNLCLH